MIWLVAGAALCLSELLLPTAFVSFMMGLSALLVGLLVPVIPSLLLQVVAWLVLSAGSIVLVRRLFPHRPHQLSNTIPQRRHRTALHRLEMILLPNPP